MATTQNVAGNLTCGSLLAQVDTASKLWPENASQKQYTANTDVLQAILENQTVQLSPLKTEKDTEVKLIWLEMCPEDTTACTDLCDAGTLQEVSSACVTYDLACLAEKGFKIPLFAFDTTSYEFDEAVAKGLLATMKALDEKLTQLGVAALVAFGGANKFTDGIFEGTDALFVPPQYWGPDIMGQLSMAAIINKFSNPYLISGSNLYMANWNAGMNAGNADGKGAQKKMGEFPAYFDLFNVDAIAGKSTFLVDPNALAFINKARFPETPMQILNGADKTLYSIASKNLPGIRYDVIHYTTCVGNDIFYNWKIKATGNFMQNPTGCDTDITGVLQFTCGNPVS
jgi:hypothetical protein